MTGTFGRNIRISLFGVSHGEYIGITADGLPAGMAYDRNAVERMMERRRARGDISTSRHEGDKPEVISGLYNGYTDGTPLTIIIKNTDAGHKDYPERVLRPSHADYTSYIKLAGYGDFRGGGSFSGRMTAPLTALGGFLKSALEKKGILIASHLSSVGEIRDDDFEEADESLLKEQFAALSDSPFPVINGERGDEMKNAVREAAAEGNSLGGTVETAVAGLPKGVGSPFFDSLESVISHLAFSVPAVKGIEFGMGFGLAYLSGIEANDQFAFDGGVKTISNLSGGINGGISNGMPLIYRVVFRPTPSIAKRQQTVDLLTKEEKPLELKGRHDPCIAHRAVPVMEAVTAIGLFDLLLDKGRDLWKAGF